MEEEKKRTSLEAENSTLEKPKSLSNTPPLTPLPSSPRTIYNSPTFVVESKHRKTPSLDELNSNWDQLKKEELEADIELSEACITLLELAEHYFRLYGNLRKDASKLVSDLDELIQTGGQNSLSFNYLLDYLHRKLIAADDKQLIKKEEKKKTRIFTDNIPDRLSNLDTLCKSIGNPETILRPSPRFSNASRRSVVKGKDPEYEEISALLEKLNVQKLKELEKRYWNLHQQYGELADQFKDKFENEELDPESRIACYQKIIEMTDESPYMLVGVPFGGQQNPRFPSYYGILHTSVRKLLELTKECGSGEEKKSEQKKDTIERIDRNFSLELSEMFSVSEENSNVEPSNSIEISQTVNREESKSAQEGLITKEPTKDINLSLSTPSKASKSKSQEELITDGLAPIDADSVGVIKAKGELSKVLKEIKKAKNESKADTDTLENNAYITLAYFHKQQDGDRILSVKHRVQLMTDLLKCKLRIRTLIHQEGANNLNQERLEASLKGIKKLNTILESDRPYNLNSCDNEIRVLTTCVQDLEKQIEERKKSQTNNQNVTPISNSFTSNKTSTPNAEPLGILITSDDGVPETNLDLAVLNITPKDKQFLEYFPKADELVKAKQAESKAKAELDYLLRNPPPKDENAGKQKKRKRNAGDDIEEARVLAAKNTYNIAVKKAKITLKYATALRELRETEVSLLVQKPKSPENFPVGRLDLDDNDDKYGPNSPARARPESMPESPEILEGNKKKDHKQRYDLAKQKLEEFVKLEKKLIPENKNALESAVESASMSAGPVGKKTRTDQFGERKLYADFHKLDLEINAYENPKKKPKKRKRGKNESLDLQALYQKRKEYRLQIDLLETDKRLNKSMRAKAIENFEVQQKSLEAINQELAEFKDEEDPHKIHASKPSISLSLNFVNMTEEVKLEVQNEIKTGQLSRKQIFDRAERTRKDLGDLNSASDNITKVLSDNNLTEGSQRSAYNSARRVLAGSTDIDSLEKRLAKIAIGIIVKIIKQQTRWMRAANGCQLNPEQTKEFLSIQENIQKLEDSILYLQKRFLEKSEQPQNLIKFHDPVKQKPGTIKLNKLKEKTKVIRSAKQGNNPVTAGQQSMIEASKECSNLKTSLSQLCLGPFTDLLLAYENYSVQLRSQRINKDSRGLANLAYLEDEQRKDAQRIGAFSEGQNSGIYDLLEFFWKYANPQSSDKDEKKSLNANTKPSNEDEKKSSPLPQNADYTFTSCLEDFKNICTQSGLNQIERKIPLLNDSDPLSPAPLSVPFTGFSQPLSRSEYKDITEFEGSEESKKAYRGPLDNKRASELARSIRATGHLSLEGREERWLKTFQTRPFGEYWRNIQSTSAEYWNKVIDLMLIHERDKVYGLNSTVLSVSGIGKVRVFPGRRDGNLPHDKSEKPKPYLPTAEYFGLGVDAARGFLEVIKYSAENYKADGPDQSAMIENLKELLEDFRRDLDFSTSAAERRHALADFQGALISELVKHKVCKDSEQGKNQLFSMRNFVHQKTYGKNACFMTPSSTVMIFEFDSPIEVGIPEDLSDEKSKITNPWGLGYEQRKWYQAQQAKLGAVWFANVCKANKSIMEKQPNKSMEDRMPGPRNARDITLVAVDENNEVLVRQNYIHTAFPQPFGIKDSEENSAVAAANFAAVIIGHEGNRLKQALVSALASKKFHLDKNNGQKLVVHFLHGSVVLGGGDLKKGLSLQTKAEATEVVRQWIKNHPPYLQQDGNIIFYNQATSLKDRQGTEIEVVVGEDNSVINWYRALPRGKKSAKDIQHILSILADRANALEKLSASIPQEQELLADWNKIIGFIRPALKESKEKDSASGQREYDPELQGNAHKLDASNPHIDEQGSHTDISWAMKNVITRLTDATKPFADFSPQERLAIARRIQAALEVRAIRGNVKLLHPKAPGGDNYNPAVEEHEAVMLQLLTRADADGGMIPPTCECASSCDRAEEISRHVVAQINFALNSSSHCLLLRGGSMTMEKAWENGLISPNLVAVKLDANSFRTGSKSTSDGEIRGSAPGLLKDINQLRSDGVMSAFASQEEYEVVDGHHSTRKGKANLKMTTELYHKKIKNRLETQKDSKVDNKEQKQTYNRKVSSLNFQIPKSFSVLERKRPVTTTLVDDLNFAQNLLTGVVKSVDNLNQKYIQVDTDDAYSEQKNASSDNVIYVEKIAKDQLDQASKSASLSISGLKNNKQTSNVAGNKIQTLINFIKTGINTIENSLDYQARKNYLEALQAALIECFAEKQRFKIFGLDKALEELKEHIEESIQNTKEELTVNAPREAKLNFYIEGARGEEFDDEINNSYERNVSAHVKGLCDWIGAREDILDKREIGDKLKMVRILCSKVAETGKYVELRAHACILLKTVKSEIESQYSSQSEALEEDQFYQNLNYYDQRLNRDERVLFIKDQDDLMSDSDDDEPVEIKVKEKKYEPPLVPSQSELPRPPQPSLSLNESKKPQILADNQKLLPSLIAIYRQSYGKELGKMAGNYSHRATMDSNILGIILKLETPETSKDCTEADLNALVSAVEQRINELQSVVDLRYALSEALQMDLRDFNGNLKSLIQALPSGDQETDSYKRLRQAITKFISWLPGKLPAQSLPRYPSRIFRPSMDLGSSYLLGNDDPMEALYREQTWEIQSDPDVSNAINAYRHVKDEQDDAKEERKKPSKNRFGRFQTITPSGLVVPLLNKGSSSRNYKTLGNEVSLAEAKVKQAIQTAKLKTQDTQELEPLEAELISRGRDGDDETLSNTPTPIKFSYLSSSLRDNKNSRLSPLMMEDRNDQNELQSEHGGEQDGDIVRDEDRRPLLYDMPLEDPHTIPPVPSLRSWANWSRREKNRLYNIASFIVIGGLAAVLGIVASGASILSYYLTYAIPSTAIYFALLITIALISAALAHNSLRFTRRNWDHVCLDIEAVEKESRDDNPRRTLFREFVLSSLKALYKEDTRRNATIFTDNVRIYYIKILHNVLARLNDSNHQVDDFDIQQSREWLKFLVNTNDIFNEQRTFTDRYPKFKKVIMGIGSPVSLGLFIVSGFFAVNQLGMADKYLAHRIFGSEGFDRILEVAKNMNLWIILGTVATVTMALALQRWSATREGHSRYRGYDDFLQHPMNSGEEEFLNPDHQNRQLHIDTLKASLEQGRHLAGDVTPLKKRAADLIQPWPGFRSWSKRLLGSIFITPSKFWELPPRRKFKYVLNLTFTGLAIGLLASGNEYLGSTILGADLLGSALFVYLAVQLLQEFRAAWQSYKSGEVLENPDDDGNAYGYEVEFYQQPPDERDNIPEPSQVSRNSNERDEIKLTTPPPDRPNPPDDITLVQQDNKEEKKEEDNKADQDEANKLPGLVAAGDLEGVQSSLASIKKNLDLNEVGLIVTLSWTSPETNNQTLEKLADSKGHSDVATYLRQQRESAVTGIETLLPSIASAGNNEGMGGFGTIFGATSYQAYDENQRIWLTKTYSDPSSGTPKTLEEIANNSGNADVAGYLRTRREELQKALQVPNLDPLLPIDIGQNDNDDKKNLQSSSIIHVLSKSISQTFSSSSSSGSPQDSSLTSLPPDSSSSSSSMSLNISGENTTT